MGYIFDALQRAKLPLPRPESTAPISDEAIASPMIGSDDVAPPQYNCEAPGDDAVHVDLSQVAPGMKGPLHAFDRKNVDDRLVPLSAAGGVAAEEYRSIRTGILARWQQRRHLVHTITSATPQEGKTITSLNLGLSFAELRNRKTIVIEADLRLPQFQKLLRLPDGPGLISLLRDKVDFASCVNVVGENELHVIAAGSRANNDAVQLLSSGRMSLLLQELRQKYDHVIVDTPPVVELADAGILGAQSDDVFLIARMGRTPRSLIEQAARTLASYNAPVAGMIATDQSRDRRKYYYKYGYHYQQRYTSKAA